MPIPNASLARPPRPQVIACYEHAGHAFLAHLAPLLVVGLVVGAVALLGTALTDAHGLIGLVGLAFGAFVVTPMRWGFYSLCLDAARGEPAEPERMVRVRENYREVVIAGIICWLMVIVGLVLLILPGVYLYLRLQFVPYLVVNEGLDAGSAIRESFELTRGREATILGIVAVGLIASGLGTLAFGIGIVPALIWWDLAMASLYHAEVLPSRHDPDPIADVMDEGLAF